MFQANINPEHAFPSLSPEQVETEQSFDPGVAFEGSLAIVARLVAKCDDYGCKSQCTDEYCSRELDLQDDG
jgi:hypothetical protein